MCSRIYIIGENVFGRQFRHFGQPRSQGFLERRSPGNLVARGKAFTNSGYLFIEFVFSSLWGSVAKWSHLLKQSCSFCSASSISVTILRHYPERVAIFPSLFPDNVCHGYYKTCWITWSNHSFYDVLVFVFYDVPILMRPCISVV